MALGWHASVLKQENSQVYWHNGGTGGYRSFTGFVKDSARGVVILSNYGLASEPDIDTIGIAVLKLLVDARGTHEREDL